MSGPGSTLTADSLFVGATRPPMRFGVTYSALLFNAVMVMQIFLLTKNLLTLLLALPVHGIFALLCSRDARFFDLLLIRCRTGSLGLLGNSRWWKANAYSPFVPEPAGASGGRRRCEPACIAPVGPELRS